MEGDASFDAVVVLLIFAVPVAWLVAAYGLRRNRTRAILAKGLPGQALVLAVSRQRGGSTERPRVAIALQVVPQEGPPFEATVVRALGVLDAPHVVPGRTFAVRYDPSDHSRVALVPSP